MGDITESIVSALLQVRELFSIPALSRDLGERLFRKCYTVLGARLAELHDSFVLDEAKRRQFWHKPFRCCGMTEASAHDLAVRLCRDVFTSIQVCAGVLPDPPGRPDDVPQTFLEPLPETLPEAAWERIVAYLAEKEGTIPFDELGAWCRSEAKLGPDSEPPAELSEYSEEDTPSNWARRFCISVDTFKRRVKAGKIRAVKITSKSYRVHKDDLPPTK